MSVKDGLTDLRSNMNKLLALLRTPSTRAYIYTVLAAVAAALVSYGVLEANDATLLVGVAVALLALPSPALLVPQRPKPELPATPEQDEENVNAA